MNSSSFLTPRPPAPFPLPPLSLPPLSLPPLSSLPRFGVPFQYTKSHVLLARLEFLQTHYGIKEADFLNFDALRQAAQCVGRVIRSKTDYGLMIFADARYNRTDKRSKLPKWIQHFLKDEYMNLSTDVAMGYVKKFLREMSQPIDQAMLQSVFFGEDDIEQLERDEREAIENVVAANRAGGGGGGGERGGG